MPEGKALGVTSDDVCLARKSVHTQHQMVPKFRQYRPNVPVHCPVQTKQLELRYWQLFCESEASRRNFFAGGGVIGSGSADMDVASVAGVTLPGV